MEGIIGLVIGGIVLLVFYAWLVAMLQKYFWLKYILALVGGVYCGFVWPWWTGIIAFFLISGILFGIETSLGHQCAHCGSYDTKLIRQDGSFASWQCNKCHAITYKT